MLLIILLFVGAEAALAAVSWHFRSKPEVGKLSLDLNAASGTPDTTMHMIEQALSRRLDAEGLPGAAIVVRGTVLHVHVNGDPSDIDLTVTPESLIGQGHLEIRELLAESRLKPGEARLTSCPRFALLGSSCVVHQVQCRSGPREPPDCTDASLAHRKVIYLSAGGGLKTLGPALLTDDVIDAQEGPVPTTDPRQVISGEQVELTLSPAGARRFAEVTGRLVGRRIAFVVDREVMQAPTVAVPIMDGHATFVVHFSELVARDLAATLSSGELPASLSVGRTRYLVRLPTHSSVDDATSAGIVGVAAIGSGLAVAWARRRRAHWRTPSSIRE